MNKETHKKTLEISKRKAVKAQNEMKHDHEQPQNACTVPIDLQQVFFSSLV